MLEYLQAYLSPFSWAKAAYKAYLGGNPLPVSPSLPELSAPISPSVSIRPLNVQTSTDWNITTQDQVSTIAGLYSSIDLGASYYNSMYSLLDSRLSEDETNVRALESSLTSIIGSSVLLASTQINIQGGDFTLIDSDPAFYNNVQQLIGNTQENVFRLPDTGGFSSIRGLGGFPGSLVIENALGLVFEQGDLASIVSTSKSAFWMSTFFSPGIVRGFDNSTCWLPSSYSDGFALQLTCYLDTPILATEIFLNPVTTEPFDLVSVSWSPTLNSCIPVFNNTWSTSGSIIDLSNNCYSFSPGSTASTLFSIPASVLVSGGDLVTVGNRAEIWYTMKGIGDCNAGARISWLNSSGTVLSHKLAQNYASGFDNTYRLVDYFPSNAASGYLEFGIFTSSSNPATAVIHAPNVYIGEQVFQVGASINGPTTIQFPQAIRTSRFSCVLNQRNPRREVIRVNPNPISFTPITGNPDLNVTAQNLTKQLADTYSTTGPNISSFAYRIGLGELDLRYREHVPQGSIVSLPLKTNQEIRWLWASVQTGLNNNDGITVDIYPFEKDSGSYVTIKPFIVDALNPNNAIPGDILRIYTTEEVASGYYNPLDTSFVTSYVNVTEEFNGTDINGTVTLQSPVHIRLPLLNSINNWLSKNSIWPSTFDPNLNVLVGIPNTTAGQSLKSQIINGAVSGEIDSSNFVWIDGYVPLNVTIVTSDWTGYQDVYGRPTTTGVKSVLGEVLKRTPQTQTQVQTRTAYITYNAWINQVTARDMLAHTNLVAPNLTSSLNGIINNQTNTTGNFSSGFTRAIFDKIVNNKTLIDQPVSQALSTLGIKSANLTKIYNAFLANGLVDIDKNATITLQTEIATQNVYATQFSPIVGGNSGQFLKLFWSNTASGINTPISQTDYSLDPKTGLITITSLPPSIISTVSGSVTFSNPYTEILADYSYISDSSNEDFHGAVMGLINTYSPTGSSIVNQLSTFTKPYPLVRNMTDYVNGKIPTLRPPNFSQLDPNYYPVIEYYVTAKNQVQFSTSDFFAYGKTPATIYVNHDTLNIVPRIGAFVQRLGSYATTPSIYSLSLNVKENASSLLRSS